MSAQDPESQHRLKIAFILSGLHSVNRGAEVAFEAVASRLSRSEAFDVTLFGMGHPKPDDPYRFVHVSGVRRNWFRRIPSLPVMRDETSWEELIFSAALFAKYRPNELSFHQLADFGARRRGSLSETPVCDAKWRLAGSIQSKRVQVLSLRWDHLHKPGLL